MPSPCEYLEAYFTPFTWGLPEIRTQDLRVSDTALYQWATKP